MASWLELALIFILIGLLLGVGAFVTVGKVLLLVVLVLLLLGVVGNMLRRSRTAHP